MDDLESDFGVGRPSLLIEVLLLLELIRKKFLIFWGKSLELFACFEVFDRPEKLRFSLWTVEVFDEELKSCVILLQYHRRSLEGKSAIGVVGSWGEGALLYIAPFVL